MFFISKILFFFLSPFTWILLLLIYIVSIKNDKLKKKLSYVLLIMILFFSNPWILNTLQYPFHAPPLPMRANEKYELGVVLGGMTSYDRVNKEGHFNMSSDRFIQTALLYKKGHIKKIIASGGQNGMFKEDNFVEAEFIAQNLIGLGIPKEDIIIEGKSKNTIENAEFTFKHLQSIGIENSKVVLITSAFHIPRAMETFKQAGIEVRPYPCAFSILPSSIKFGPASLLPASWVLDAWGGFFKELLGRLYLKL
jgi:uncharacterized SAM-binding protein YcdF (DUF218 family)